METPKKYQELFESDWNKGHQSKTKPLERVRLNQLWLEFNKWQLTNKIIDEKPIDDVKIGFVDI